MSAWLLALVLGTATSPCDDAVGEREALVRAASGGHFADIAAALEQRCGAPIAAGVELSGEPRLVAEVLGKRLEAFCAGARAAGAPALRGGDREHLEAILARPEFAHARAPDVNGLARLAAWLTAWMDRLFETSGAQSFAKGTRVLVLALALAVVLGVVLRVGSALRRRDERVRTERRPAPARVLDAPEKHLARAGTMVEANPREAIREGLFALLASLERRALARPDRVKTNREVAEEVAQRGAAPEVTERVRGLLGWYDRAYYSLERPPAPEARRFIDDVAALAGTLAERPA